MKNQTINTAAFIFALFALLAVGSLFADNATPGSEVRRFGLFIGANDGGAERVRLKYAVSDARSLAGVMTELGGMETSDILVLAEPDAETVQKAFGALSARMNQFRSQARRLEVVFYYSGHSDEAGLLLRTGHYSYRELRSELDGLKADVRLAILDSCSSGAFTRLKGGSRQAPFLIDASTEMRGHAYLTSSSEDEASQESDVIKASFFTHFLISGLRGAADSTRDGRVTLNELYHHAYTETLNRTESTASGPQHPSYDIQLAGTGDLVISDLAAIGSRLVLHEAIEGRVFIRDSSDRLVAEIAKRKDAMVTLALPTGNYSVRVQGPAGIAGARVSLAADRRTTLAPADLTTAVAEVNRTRGDVLETAAASIPSAQEAVTAATTPDLPQVQPIFIPMHIGIFVSASEMEGRPINAGLALAGITANAHSVSGILAGGIMANATGDVSGAAGAGVGAVVKGHMTGYATAGVFSVVEKGFEGCITAGTFVSVKGNSEGFQAAGVFSLLEGNFQGGQASGVFSQVLGNLRGGQFSGVFNKVSGSMEGAQCAGVFNLTEGSLGGFQAAGIFNVAGNVSGFQVSLVNVAKSVSGVQLGLINISDEMNGIPIGLLNFIRNGIYDIRYTISDAGAMELAMMWGSREVYTVAGMATSQNVFSGQPAPAGLMVGMGKRNRLQSLSIDVEGGAKWYTPDFVLSRSALESRSSWEAFGYSTYPYIQLTAALDILGDFAVVAGVVWDITLHGVTTENEYLTRNRVDWETPFGFTMGFAPKYFVGLRF